MKQIILILTLISTAFLSVNAQSFGIKAGPAYSNLSNRGGDVDANARLGFTAGFLADLPVIGGFSLQPELLYTQKGSTYTFPAVETEIRLAYIDIPIGAKFDIGGGPAYFILGTKFSYLIDQEREYEYFNEIDVEFDDDIDSYNRTDVGGFIGLGIDLEHFAIDARFAKGVIDYDKERSFSEIDDDIENLQNYSFQLTGALKF